MVKALTKKAIFEICERRREMEHLTKREKNSSRLRNTEELAQLCDFEYNTRTNKYGGFLSVFQLEKIVRTILELQNKIQTLNEEAEKLRKEFKNG
jgi:hypothetical protein